MVSDLNMSHGKMSDFVSFPLFRFTLVIKLRNFDFKGHQNIQYFLIKKWCQIWLCPVKQCLIWFKLCCLSKKLEITWEIRILNFIEIVNALKLRNLLSDKNLSFFFFCLLALLEKQFWIKNVFIDFRIHWNTLMKILYLKGYKWLLSQIERVRIDALG